MSVSGGQTEVGTVVEPISSVEYSPGVGAGEIKRERSSGRRVKVGVW